MWPQQNLLQWTWHCFTYPHTRKNGMNTHSPGKFSVAKCVLFAGLAAAGLQFAPAAIAASGAPLPRCTPNTQSLYIARYTEGAAGQFPTVALDKVQLGAGSTVTSTTVWSGQGAPVPAPEASGNAGATVAMGMNRQNGYIYAIRAVGNDPAWPGTWQSHNRRIQVLTSGAPGVDNLGTIQGLPNGTGGAGDLWQQLGPNYNAADVDPVTGDLIIATFQTGGSLSRLIRVSLTGDVPTYSSTLTLSGPIPGAQSGDFAINAAGTHAYGVAYTAGTSIPLVFPSSTPYSINLSTGLVTYLPAVTGADAFVPYGAGATLQDGNMAFYSSGGSSGPITIPPSIRVMTPAGALSGTYTYTGSNSADAASCLPKLKAKLECTPTALVDADNNVSTCTVTLDQAAPAAGMSVALTLPASNPRYSTTCASPVTFAAGQTTAQCTITATPNVVPADGNATADISLRTPDPLAHYELDPPTSASIVVQNDDLPTVSIACTPATLVDSAGQESVCTISSNVPAPVGGMRVGLTTFAANPRYATTCGASVVLAEGTSSSTCTVTATANTVPSDGSVTGSIALQANAAAYNLGTPSSADVVVNDDDSVTPPGGNGDPIGVPVGGWPAGLGLAALAWAQLRKRRQTAQTD